MRVQLELEVLKNLNEKQADIHNAAFLRTAKELEGSLCQAMIDMDAAHSEMILQVMSGAGEAFDANNRVVALHNGVNNAISKLWGIGFQVAAEEPVEDPNTGERYTISSSQTTTVRPNRVTYLEKTRLPTFSGRLIDYPNFKA